MEFTQISPLKQSISRIGLGTWAIGGWMWGGTEEKEAIRTLIKAFEKKINFIDTAPVYGFGQSEEIVGKAIKSYGKREQIVIGTKLGIRWKEDKKVYRDTRKEVMIKEVEDSLRRLQVDYIDLYQVHWREQFF